MKVLVADDEVVSRRLIETSVRRWGYESSSPAMDWKPRRSSIRPDAPKLAVLDWLMPGLDGVQLCRQLRHRQKTTRTPTSFC